MSWMVRNSISRTNRRNHEYTVCRGGNSFGSMRRPPPERVVSAIDEIRSWTDKRLIESGKWGAGVIEQMKSAAEGIVRLQALVGRSEKRDHGSST